MQSRQKLVLALALVFAGIAAFLSYGYLTNLKEPTVVHAQRTVFVAARDLQARSPINPSLLESVSRPVDSVDRDAITNLDQLRNAIALTTIPQGSVITLSRIGRPENAPLTARMPRGTRAVTISIDPVRGDASLIQPGDRVDIVSVQHGTGAMAFNALAAAGKVKPVQTIMRGALVLAMGKKIENTTPGNAPGATDPNNGGDANTVTLAMNPKDVEELAFADATSSLHLSLRPARENIPKTISEPYVLLTPSPAPAAAAPAPQRQATITIVPLQKQTQDLRHAPVAITVIDGDHVVGAGK